MPAPGPTPRPMPKPLGTLLLLLGALLLAQLGRSQAQADAWQSGEIGQLGYTTVRRGSGSGGASFPARAARLAAAKRCLGDSCPRRAIGYIVPIPLPLHPLADLQRRPGRLRLRRPPRLGLALCRARRRRPRRQPLYRRHHPAGLRHVHRGAVRRRGRLRRRRLPDAGGPRDRPLRRLRRRGRLPGPLGLRPCHWRHLAGTGGGPLPQGELMLQGAAALGCAGGKRGLQLSVHFASRSLAPQSVARPPPAWACSLANCPPLLSSVLAPQVNCNPPGNLAVKVDQYQGGWLRLALTNVAGSGDVTSVELAPSAVSGGTLSPALLSKGASWEGEGGASLSRQQAAGS